ncbi:MAG: hypothetical protein ABRQ25_19170 [Clostridiaceae bacterium]
MEYIKPLAGIGAIKIVADKDVKNITKSFYNISFMFYINWITSINRILTVAFLLNYTEYQLYLLIWQPLAPSLKSSRHL